MMAALCYNTDPMTIRYQAIRLSHDLLRNTRARREAAKKLAEPRNEEPVKEEELKTSQPRLGFDYGYIYGCDEDDTFHHLYPEGLDNPQQKEQYYPEDGLIERENEQALQGAIKQPRDPWDEEAKVRDPWDKEAEVRMRKSLFLKI